jgi:hypothetical protein
MEESFLLSHIALPPTELRIVRFDLRDVLRNACCVFSEQILGIPRIPQCALLIHEVALAG